MRAETREQRGARQREQESTSHVNAGLDAESFRHEGRVLCCHVLSEIKGKATSRLVQLASRDLL
eukprot:2234034-Rhodomonas_salina.3